MPSEPKPTLKQNLYTPSQVGELLSCSRMHVYRLIRQGELPTVNIAQAGAERTKIRVRADVLESYLDSHVLEV